MRILYHFRTQGTGAEDVHISGIATAFEQLGHRAAIRCSAVSALRRRASDPDHGTDDPAMATSTVTVLCKSLKKREEAETGAAGLNAGLQAQVP
jgi:hypothetical protein